MPTRRTTAKHDHGQLIAKSALVAALALTPVVVSPWTAEVWESAKIVFLAACAVVALVGALWSWRRSIPTLRFTPVDIALLLVLIVGKIGLLVSPSFRASLVGFPGYANDSYIALAAVGILLFVALHVRVTRQELFAAFGMILGGWTLVLFVQLFQFSGVYLLGFSTSHDTVFSLAGNSLRSTGLLAVEVLTFAVLLVNVVNRALWRWLLAVPAAAALLVLLLIDDQVAWIALALASLVPLVFSFVQRKVDRTAKMMIGGLLLVALVGLIAPLGERTQLTPTDLLLPQKESLSIVGETLRHSPVWGSGPATFYYDFVQYRPESFNALPEWSFRFLKAGNQWEQWLATLGLLGTAALASVFALCAWAAWRISQRSKHLDLHLLAAAAISLSVILSFLTPFSLSLLVMFLAGLVVYLWWLQVEGFSFPTWEWRWPTWFSSVFAIAVVATAIVGFGWLSRASEAAIVLERARVLQGNGAPLTTVSATLERGHSIDPSNPLLTMALAQQRIAIVRSQVNNSEITSTKAADDIREALVLADESISQDKKNPARYESVIDLYETLAQFVADADVGAAALYQKLISLEPANPRHEFGLGQTLLVKATRLSAEAESFTNEEDKAAREKDAAAAVVEAKTHLERAIALRPDYPDALFRLALAEELGGNPVAARDRLASLVPLVPTSPDAWYELGRLQLATEQKDKAIDSFMQVVTLFPNHSNAHYQLGTIYASQGKTDDAKKEFQIVLTLNPGNTEIQKKLDELSKK
jgi:tetratricopeptide (TPR) repeat protein